MKLVLLQGVKPLSLAVAHCHSLGSSSLPVMTQPLSQPGQSWGPRSALGAALAPPASFRANTPTRGRSAGTRLPTGGSCGFLCRPPLRVLSQGAPGLGSRIWGTREEGAGDAAMQLLHSASVLSRALCAASLYVLRKSRDVDATAEDQKVSGACGGEVGWAHPASAMAVQLLLRESALLVIQSPQAPCGKTIPSTCPLCTRRGGSENAADHPDGRALCADSAL